MISSLQELISPWTLTEFSDWLRTRTLQFQRGAGENLFAGVADWPTTRALIESNAIAATDFRLTSRTRPVPATFYRDIVGVDCGKFAQLLEKGASVVLNPLHPHIPSLRTLNDDIQRFAPGEKVKITGTLTTGAGGAFRPHYDPEDILTIQVEGTKRWRIYSHITENPVWGTPRRGKFEGEPVFDQVLRPGDVLFMPAGYWHVCDNDGPSYSYHLGVMFQPPTGWDAVCGLLTQLLDIDIFRVPLSRIEDAEVRASHEATLKARLVELVGHVSFDDLLGRSFNVKRPSASQYDD